MVGGGRWTIGPSRSSLGGSAKRELATACASSVAFSRHSCLSSSLRPAANPKFRQEVVYNLYILVRKRVSTTCNWSLVNLEAAAAATWCDGSYAIRLPRSTSQLEAASAPSAMAAPLRERGWRLGKEPKAAREELGFYLGRSSAAVMCLESAQSDSP